MAQEVYVHVLWDLSCSLYTLDRQIWMIGRQAAAKGQGCFHHSFLLCALFTTLHEQSTLPEATLTLLLRNDLESLNFADPQLTRFISKCFIKRKAWKDSARRNKPPHPPRTYPAPPFYLFPQFVIILLNIWTAGDRCKRSIPQISHPLLVM